MSIDSTCSKKFNLERATNFMRQFRDPDSRELKKLSANQFMEVWSHYDRDGNGYIEGTELDGFLKEFVSSANFTDISPDMKTILALLFVAVIAAVSDSFEIVKISPVADLETYADEVETTSFSVASRNTRLNVGSVLSGDRVLYSSDLSHQAVANVTNTQEIMFSSASVITSLLVVEIGTTDSTAVIGDGGVGSTNVTVRFTSDVGGAFNFRCIVFGR